MTTEWTRRQDLIHRLWALRRSIERYTGLVQTQMNMMARLGPTGYTVDDQKLNSETDSQLEIVLNDSNNLRRALEPFPSLRRPYSALFEALRHVRNIREHWNENRRFWSDAAPIPAERKFASARWYKGHFPDKLPWSSSWSNVDGQVICGIVRLDEVVAMLDQLEGQIRPGETS